MMLGIIIPEIPTSLPVANEFYLFLTSACVSGLHYSLCLTYIFEVFVFVPYRYHKYFGPVLLVLPFKDPVGSNS